MLGYFFMVLLFPQLVWKVRYNHSIFSFLFKTSHQETLSLAYPRISGATLESVIGHHTGKDLKYEKNHDQSNNNKETKKNNRSACEYTLNKFGILPCKLEKKTSDRKTEGLKRGGHLTMTSISTWSRPLNPTCWYCLTIFKMYNSPLNYLIINRFLEDTISL